MTKLYSLTIRNRAAAALFGIGVVAIGAVFLTLGLALLLGMVVAAGVIGAVVAGYRRLRPGGRADRQASARPHMERLWNDSAAGSRVRAGLDPALQVKPPVTATVRLLDEND